MVDISSRRGRGRRPSKGGDGMLRSMFLVSVVLITASMLMLPAPGDDLHEPLQKKVDSKKKVLGPHTIAAHSAALALDGNRIAQKASTPTKKDVATKKVEAKKTVHSAHVDVDATKVDATKHAVVAEELKAQEKMESIADENKGETFNADDSNRENNYDPLPVTNGGAIDGVNYHLVFSTGCSTFQDWQSYVFFFHALKSGQRGHVTRIASGCSEENSATLREIFDREIATMAPGRFHLHLTPDFSKVKPGVNFKYFNKPFGMRHWLQHGLGFPDDKSQEDSIVILLDPDQILLRPFTNDFTNSSEVWRLKDGYKLKVEHGSPFAQQYGFALQWKTKVNITHVAPNGVSPVSTLDTRDAQKYYNAMGPPYVATGKDMYSIVWNWSDMVPRVHDDYPHLLAEMFAYNLAAAHLELRHTIAFGFMVSDVFAGGEGWDLVNKVEAADACYSFPKSLYPHVIHYCQRYTLGKWFIGKYRLRKDFISCESPLLALPPGDIGVKYDYGLFPDGSKKTYKNANMPREMAFMICHLIPALNQAATYYKDTHCAAGTANYEKSYTFFEDMSIEGEENA